MAETTSGSKKTVIIVGAGFAGLHAAKVLGRKGEEFSIIVIDRHNYHLFQPLLYQVAMAGLSPAEIAYPIRSLLSEFTNVRVLMGEVKGIALAQKEVSGDFGTLKYDYLIVATGAQHSYFGHEEWEEFAPGLKTLEQATEIRRRVLTAFELAERELAGALGEISRYNLDHDFRNIDPRRTRVVLIEAGQRVLAGFDEPCSSRALRDLEKLGVSVWTGTRVTSITPEGVSMGKETLRTSTVIWAAGVKPSALNSHFGTPLDGAGRVVVTEDLSVPGFPEVFVAGDQSAFLENGKPLPGLAPVAMQGGRHAARNILRLAKGEKTLPFRYNDKGIMATIGRARAVVQYGNLRLYGFTAWCAWLFVHIYYLIGFKNRVFVLFSWIWAYVTYGRGARLITHKNWKTET
jgi:NADH dehydrogenase